MKKLSEVISTLVTLFFACAIIYGGLKEGYIWQTILIVGIILFAIYIFSEREDNLAKMQQQKMEKENREKFDEKLKRFAYKMYNFAHHNERISKVTYDIEEGGDYLTEFDKIGCRRIDDIINKHVKYPRENFEYLAPNIQKEILELPKQPKNKYIGF